MAMVTVQKRMLLDTLRDFLVGLAVFAALCVPFSGQTAMSSAIASDAVVSQAIEASSPTGVVADNARVAALIRLPVASPGPHTSTLVILGLTFAVMFTFNLAISRHLRRVYASPRRSAWRRGG